MIIYGLKTVQSFKVTFALKVTLTIYLFYNLYRFFLELSTNILTMIILSSFKVIFTLYLFYNLCRCILVLSYTRYKHINNDLSFYPSRWPLLYIYFTISVDFPMLYWLALYTNILIMIHLPSRWSLLYIYFTVSVDLPLLYWLALSTSILIMIHLPSRWPFLFILHSLHPYTGYTEYKDICNNPLVYWV